MFTAARFCCSAILLGSHYEYDYDCISRFVWLASDVLMNVCLDFVRLYAVLAKNKTNLLGVVSSASSRQLCCDFDLREGKRLIHRTAKIHNPNYSYKFHPKKLPISCSAPIFIFRCNERRDLRTMRWSRDEWVVNREVSLLVNGIVVCTWCGVLNAKYACEEHCEWSGDNDTEEKWVVNVIWV